MVHAPAGGGGGTGSSLKALTSPPNLVFNGAVSQRSAIYAVRRREPVERMNKQELIGHVADRAGLSRHDAARAVETMLEVVTATLSEATKCAWSASATSR